MPVFNSRINSSSDSFKQNRQDMLALVEKLQGDTGGDEPGRAGNENFLHGGVLVG